MARLAKSTLTQARALLPDYDRSSVSPGVVHLGLGAFHRAHQAVYIDSLLAREPQWGIVGASLRSAATARALIPQDGLYTLALEDQYRIIGSVAQVLDCSQVRAPLLACLADERIRIVMLTVTEKGYCHEPATGDLLEDAPEIQHDLMNLSDPHTLPGILVAAIRARRAAGAPPLTIVSCDNLADNGRTTRKIVEQFACLAGTDLQGYIEAELAFPATMVDRIVPATTDVDRQRVKQAIGLEDAWPVMTEGFSQWVVENDFRSGRPALDSVGVHLVGDVRPYELIKLRMLNASHSAIAYLGYLAGYETVADVMANADFEAFVRRMMQLEIAPAIDGPIGFDLNGYAEELIERFKSRALRHRTWQIAMDGSQKLPPRILDTVRDRLHRGQDFPRLALTVAGWIRYASGTDEKGGAIDVRDPMRGSFAALPDPVGAGVKPALAGYLSLTKVFGEDLPADHRFRQTVEQSLEILVAIGATAAVARLR